MGAFLLLAKMGFGICTLCLFLKRKVQSRNLPPSFLHQIVILMCRESLLFQSLLTSSSGQRQKLCFFPSAQITPMQRLWASSTSSPNSRAITAFAWETSPSGSIPQTYSDLAMISLLIQLEMFSQSSTYNILFRLKVNNFPLNLFTFSSCVVLYFAVK